MSALPTIRSAPRWVWRAHGGIEPSVPLRLIEDAVWLAGFGMAVGLALGWAWWLHRPPALDLLRWLIHLSPQSLLLGWLPALVCGALFAPLGFSARDRLRHISGPRLFEGREAFQRGHAWASSVGGRAANVSLHPALPLPSAVWNRHVLIYGSVGSGKTQILAHIVRQVAAQPKARALLADSKGDWVAMLPDAVLLCPWDARSVAWDIAGDIRSGVDAAGFAQALVPSGDPRSRFWVEASRSMVEGALLTLLAEHPNRTWGWRELRDLLRLDAKAMAARIGPHHPQVTQVLAAGEQTQGSILASLAADTRLVDVLAQAWPERGAWSMRAWLSGGTKLPRKVVVQAGADPSASRALLGLILATTSRRMLAPSMSETRQTRLWLVLDELSAAGRLDDLPALIERGRSKGICVLAGIQDVEQLAAIYGREIATGLSSMVGLQVVCQTGPGPTRDRIAELVGKRRVAITAHSVQGPDHAPTAHTKSLHEETRHLLLSSDLSRSLGPWRHGKRSFIRALVMPSGADVFALDWPIIPLTAARLPHQAAAWTRCPASPIARSEPATQPATLAAGTASNAVAPSANVDTPSVSLPFRNLSVSEGASRAH